VLAVKSGTASAFAAAMVREVSWLSWTVVFSNLRCRVDFGQVTDAAGIHDGVV
jgi:hypothetical protein